MVLFILAFRVRMVQFGGEMRFFHPIKGVMRRIKFWTTGLFAGLMFLFVAGCDKSNDLELNLFGDIKAPAATEFTATLPAAPLLQDELAGEWLFTSYNINGIEYMGTVVKSAVFRFSEVAMPDASYEQEVYFYEGGYDKFFGIYQVNEELGTLTLTCGPQVNEGKLHFEGGVKMIWKGMHGTVPVVIMAKRNVNAQ